jgi:hypothetical protein
LDYVAGDGIAIQTTSPYTPAAPGIVATGGVNNVESLTLTNGATRVLIIGLASGSVQVDITAITVLIIDGMEVVKGSGNTDYDDIEAGDNVKGWISDTRYVAGKVNALPWDTEGNTDWAIDNELIES